MANVNPLPCNTGFKYEHNGQLNVRYSTKKDVKYLKCVDDNCPSRATLKNGNTRITTEHAQHDAVTEEISKLKIVGQCRKTAAEEDSQTLRQMFDEILLLFHSIISIIIDVLLHAVSITCSFVYVPFQ